MQRGKVLALLVGVVTCSVAHAASVRSIRSSSNPTASQSPWMRRRRAATSTRCLLVASRPQRATGAPNTNSGLVVHTRVPRANRSTYRNQILALDTTDPDYPGGLGWTIAGAVTTGSELSFTGGPLGAKITAPAGARSVPGECEHAHRHWQLHGADDQRRRPRPRADGHDRCSGTGVLQLGRRCSVRSGRRPSTLGLVLSH